MQQKIKSLFTITLLFSLLVFNTSCSSDDSGGDDGIDCSEVTAALEATISSDVSSMCSGGEAEITITGTPNSEVTYSDGTTSTVLSLGDSGTESWSVTPSATTDFSLEKIEQGGCEKTLTDMITVTIGGPAITENIVGTWSVIDANDQSDGMTVTFNSDGTGTAPQDGSFSMYSSTLLEWSNGFDFEYDDFQEHFIIRYKYTAIDNPVRYEVDLNDCDEVTLRDVTHVVDPQYKFNLTRQ